MLLSVRPLSPLLRGPGSVLIIVVGALLNRRRMFRLPETSRLNIQNQKYDLKRDAQVRGRGCFAGIAMPKYSGDDLRREVVLKVITCFPLN